MSKSFMYISMALFLTIIISSCYRPSTEQTFDDINQLQGMWATYEGFTFNEYWEKTNDSLMTGIGYSLSNGDTAFKEKLKIYIMNNEVYYAAFTEEHEDYVAFKMEEATKTEWKFVNPENEYPNIIHYELINDTLLTATITNIRGNKPTVFRMERK